MESRRCCICLEVAPAVGSPAARPVDPRGRGPLCHGYHLGLHREAVTHDSLDSLGSFCGTPHLFLLQSCSSRRVHNLGGRGVYDVAGVRAANAYALMGTCLSAGSATKQQRPQQQRHLEISSWPQGLLMSMCVFQRLILRTLHL